MYIIIHMIYYIYYTILNIKNTSFSAAMVRCQKKALPVPVLPRLQVVPHGSPQPPGGGLPFGHDSP